MPYQNELTKIHQVLSSVLGEQAVIKHPGSETNPGEQIRIEYNFPPFDKGFRQIDRIEVAKRALVKLGLIDKDFQTPQHDSSPFLIIKPSVDGRFLDDATFSKEKFEKAYQEEFKQYEIEEIRNMLAYAINDGEEAVTIHPGTVTTPGLQVRIEYNFAPHNETDYNEIHFQAAQQALMELGLIAQNYANPMHGRSPFIVIKPPANHEFINNHKEYVSKFHAIYQRELRKVLSAEIQSTIASMDKALEYLNSSTRRIDQYISKEVEFNNHIQHILDLVTKGDPEKGLPDYHEWLSENKATIEGWLNSDYVNHAVKQQIQKLAYPDQYYNREYQAKDPLIALVRETLSKEEKLFFDKRLGAGSHNMSLAMDKLLQSLQELDSKGTAPHEIAKSVSQLFQTITPTDNNSALIKILTKVQKNQAYVELYNKTMDPKTITLTTLSDLLEDTKRDLSYLYDGRAHNPRGIQNRTELLNAEINEILTIALKGQEGIQPYPDWLKENKATVDKWLNSQHVNPDTKQKLKEALQQLETKIVPPQSTKVASVPQGKPAAPSASARFTAAGINPPAEIKAPTPPPRKMPTPPAEVKAAAPQRKLPTPPQGKVAQAKVAPPPPPRAKVVSPQVAATPPHKAAPATKAAPTSPRATVAGSPQAATHRSKTPPFPSGTEAKVNPPPVPPRDDLEDKVAPPPPPRDNAGMKAAPPRKLFIPNQEGKVAGARAAFAQELEQKLQGKAPKILGEVKEEPANSMPKRRPSR